MLLFAPKAPDDIKRYTWSVPVVAGDSLVSYSIASASGVTIDADSRNENDVVMYLSGGTASTTGTIKLSGATSQGEQFEETIYIPILPADNAVGHAETAQTIIEFALRPVTGITGTATSDELDDGLEWLNGLLSFWRATGADVGASLPLTLSTVIYAPDEWILAIKNNLRVMVAEQYGRTVSPTTGFMASKGLQAIKNARLGDAEPGTYY